MVTTLGSSEKFAKIKCSLLFPGNRRYCLQDIQMLSEALDSITIPIKNVHLISNQSFLKEINPVYPLEGLMLKLTLQYFGHLMPLEELTHWKRPWKDPFHLMLERLKAGREGDNRRCGNWMASLTQWT